MNTPDHYNMEIQPVEFIVKNNIPFREANIIKYVCRHRDKDSIDDLLKAQHYLQMLIDEWEAENEVIYETPTPDDEIEQLENLKAVKINKVYCKIKRESIQPDDGRDSCYGD